jgi:cytosine deaminase
VAPYLDLQLVAFPQDGYYRSPSAARNLARALDRGVDVVGGIPHFERTMADGAASVRALCEIAAERGLRVDMHCDETDDPLSRHVETLADVSKLLPLMAEAQVAAVANPLINIVIQGRHDTYPKRRGMTRIPEMRERGILCAFGHDCVMDPWYSLGSGDMLEVAHMALHVAHMTGREAMRFCFDAVTANPARIMGLEGYGLEPGCHADLVVLQAKDPIEAIRLKATRLAVVRRGRVIAETPPRVAALALADRPGTVDPASYAPPDA